MNFSAEQAQEYEKALEANPDDLDKRISLLGYYLVKKSGENSAQRIKHILWFVENKPDFKDGAHITTFMFMHPAVDKDYDKIKNGWLKQMEKSLDNPYVLRNAAGFFSFSDKKLAKELFEKAHTLDPTAPASTMELMLEQSK